MLILIAGITGMVGVPCARVALEWGHQVRGMGRNPDKLDKDLAGKLESFVQIDGVYDTKGLDKAVAGVDAIICAYNNAPELVVSAQLALLYAAERAGVKIFHAASWNYDWTKLQLGDHENYDAFIAFKRTAETSSKIKPIYGFTGGILEFVWYHNPDRSALNVKERTVSYFGTGDEKHIWVTVDNLAEYSVAAVTDPKAAEGRPYYVESFRATFPEFGKIYGEARGVEIREQCVGDNAMAEHMLAQARKHTPTWDWDKYIGLAYVTLLNAGKIGWDESIDSKRWADKVKQTDLKTWLQNNKDV